jgi:hypothetical protein
MLNQDQSARADFYDTNYDLLGEWMVRPDTKVVLGPADVRRCRFCGKEAPEVTFSKVAHAIPELLGNKSITTTYECDDCNGLFGRGIENDLGNWTKPIRTLIRIRGKGGVPTIKKGGEQPGWRIAFKDNQLKVQAREDDGVVEFDDENKRVIFKIRRDAYTPAAVLKAFMKIGLTLMPDEEMAHFEQLLEWIREPDHTKRLFEGGPIYRTMSPGPLPNDLIVAMVLRRKPGVTDLPYAFLVLSYGNEAFQVALPSLTQDRNLHGKTISLPAMPIPGHSDVGTYGVQTIQAVDLSGTSVVRGDVVTFSFGYDDKISVPVEGLTLD